MRRRTPKFSVQPRTVLKACTVVCLALIIVSFRFSSVMSPVKTGIGYVISPMQKGINSVGTSISRQLDKLKSMNELLEKNAELEKQNADLKMQNNILVQEKYELDSLRALYELDQKYSDYKKVAARVISKDTNSFYSVFTIDKGTDDGLTEDMNVMAGNGLVGIITEVGKNYAKVRSIIDDASYVSGMFLKTSDNCDVKGDLELLDEGYIRVESISMNAEVEDNYEVVTSNISDKYLPGILIGYISNIEVDSSNMSKVAYLRPAVDFEHLEEVLIITELKEQLQKNDE